MNELNKCRMFHNFVVVVMTGGDHQPSLQGRGDGNKQLGVVGHPRGGGRESVRVAGHRG